MAYQRHHLKHKKKGGKDEIHAPKIRSAFQKRVPIFTVNYDGEDLTPKPLNPFDDEFARERKITVYDASGTQKARSQTDFHSAFTTASTSKLFSQLHMNTTHTDSVGGNYKSYITVYVEEVEIEPELIDTSEISSQISDRRIMSYQAMPSEITLILTETPTFYILELPSHTVPKDTNDANLIEDENRLYEFLTSEKGRNRKVINAEVQTVPVLMKIRETETYYTRKLNNEAFASEWDMYDIYNKETKEIIEEYSSDEEYTVKKRNSLFMFDTNPDYEDIEIHKLIKNDKFHQAVCVIERLLANNNYNVQQKRFRGLSDPDPFREDIEYNYRLELLWTFSNAQTEGKCVTSISINPANEDIFAVAYGKFYFTDKATGMIMLWNIKNPVQPERLYKFEDPVTCLDFAKQNSNLLAIGFYTGKVVIIDVSSRELKIVGQSRFQDSPSFEAVWKVVFYTGDDYHVGKEHVIATGQDGRVVKYWPTDSVYLRCMQIMRVACGEGKLKGLQRLRRCTPSGIPITRYSAALTMSPHPADKHIYYIGSNEGVVHKCSTNYYHQHLDEFLAHDGPMYQMKFSPFCNKLFLTCGDDWFVRIWVDGINEPLIELSKTMQSVQSAEWSPVHSTIIASICGSEIYLWDLQRKTYQPQSITDSPTNCRNTVVKFTSSGRCLIVGDIDGNVHVFSLEDMPFQAFYQDALLRQSLFHALVTRPDLIKKITKLGDLNFNEAEFDSHFT